VHWSGYDITVLDIEVDPQCCRFGSRKPDFALQALVECRALEPERVPIHTVWDTGTVCVCLLLQDLVQSCLHGGGGYGRTCATRDDERREVREGACIGAATILHPWTLRLGLWVTVRETCVCVCVCLLLQDLVQRCLHGGGGIWEDMCYERRRAEACVD
jgi:hypothetical protein